MRTRTSFVIGKREWDFLNLLVDKAAIRRDSFIAARLAQEIKQLDELKVNSEEDNKIITHSILWVIMECTKVNISLPKELVSEMNAKCIEKNIPRSYFFHRFIQFVNLSSWYSFLILANPRKILSESHCGWLHKASRRSPIVAGYEEYVMQDRDDDLNTFLISPLDDDPYWSEHLSTFYSSELNVADDDQRRNEENQIDSEDDFLNGLEL